MDYKKIANILLPNIDKTLDYYENIYPKRNLPEGAEVTRFAPSPTGFLHIGALFTSMVVVRIAKSTNGISILRIEDTDKKREVQDGVKEIVVGLRNFGITFDEGVEEDGTEYGAYGTYIQSQRKEIYQAFAKHLIEQGRAYACFCSEEESEQLRKIQEASSVRPGYYGKYAKCRDMSFEEIEENIKQGKRFIIRLRSNGVHENRITHNDIIKGTIQMSENDQDVVILKSDGIPTYHFAHAVDDYLMGTTIVIRGDEWLSSVPLHLELFHSLGFEAPKYAHVAPIAIDDNGSKRKLSKRKDPEAAVSYYREIGVPNESVKEFLLTLINSNYEEWRESNPTEPNENFEIDLSKMSVSMPQFDRDKFVNISKNVIALMTADQVYDLSLEWAKEFDKELAEFMSNNEEYTRKIFSIERGNEKPRKDIGKWSDIKDLISFFYDELFKNEIKDGYNFNDKVSIEDVRKVMEKYCDEYDPNVDQETWFNNLKDLGEEFGYCKNVKEYKKNPDNYKGHIGDFAELFRIALANRKNTPDLYEMMQTMGYNRVINRLQQI